MTARTHDLIAFGALLTVGAYYPPAKLNLSTLVAVLVGNTVGTLIPDMDQATNRLWDLLPAGNLVGRVFRRLMLSHRTISHSILGGAILFFLANTFLPKILNPAYVNTTLVMASLMIGFVSHLAADSVTKEGIPLFFPIPFKIGFPPFAFLRITTGKFVEKFIVFPGVLIYIFWFTATRKAIFVALLRLIKN